MDVIRVANAAAVECVRQHVGIDELRDLLHAYSWLYDYKEQGMEWDNYYFEYLGRMVEPYVNRNGFRKGPVTFANGGSSASPQDIPRLMGNLCDVIAARTCSRYTDTYVKDFLWIHPFADANGRVGWILYNYLNGTMDSPEPLPDYFG